MAATFRAWDNAPLRGLADGTVVAGRLQAKVSLSIADLASAGDIRNRDAPFELLGPGDAQRLAFGVITRRYPAPGAADAEETKAVLVEFKRDDLLDLPWRYSPEVDQGGRLRPWLVLVVGADAELTIDSAGFVTLGPDVQQKHPLANSWQWAHVHDIDGTRIARILCPRDLDGNARYTACLVPSFVVGEDGTVRDAWPAAGDADVRLPCYDHWSFTTGPDGDFPELAELLRAVTPQAVGADFGTAKIRYDRRGTGTPARVTLDAAGALQRPSPPPLPAVDAWIATEVGALAEPVVTPDGRWVLTAPRYHEAFVAPGTVAVANAWSGELQDDPRDRGSAGLGAWAAIAWQDRIADAALTKAGDLAIARDRIGHLALGIEASRSLWRRRLPTDPVARLAVLAPVLARLPAAGGGTVLDAVAGRTPLFARALWSSAARRALRRGPARSHWAKEGASRLEAVLRYAARCPQRLVDPDVIRPPGNVPPADRRRAIEAAILTAGAREPKFAREIADRVLANGTEPAPGLLAVLLALLDPAGRGAPDRDAIQRLLDNGVPPAFEPADLDDALAKLAPLRHRERPCRPVDIDALGRAVAAAIDPTVARPVVVERVLGTLTGIEDIGPVDLEPELDIPLWSFLSDASPDWLLPGIGDLPEHRVVALGTNPAFVEAMLVGANTQTLNELRFRNLPLVTRWSPLRKFWQRPGGAFDIRPIGTWPGASPFGGASLQPAGVGIEAVVVFRTRLFRRYPATVVYLYKADPNWPTPPDNMPGTHVFPTFTGTIGDDVTFFGFPVPPSALADHWVVLEEPPSGYRFYTEKHGDPLPPIGGSDAAIYAYNRFALPVRVLIGALLESA
jgi:hypothetical protein